MRAARTVGLVVAIALVAPGRIRAQEAPSPSLSADNIATAIGSDADARAVLSIVLAQVFLASNHTEQFLLRSQIRPEWIPVVDPVHAILLTAAEADTLRRASGTYWTVSRIKRSPRLVSVRLTNECDGSWWEYAASLNGKQWELVPGFGMGALGPGSRVTAPGARLPQSTGCSCLP